MLCLGMWIKINSGWEHIIFDYVWHWNLFECVWPNKAAGWPFALLYQVRLFVQQSGKMYCQDVHRINVFRLHPSVGVNGSITDHREVLDNAYKCWGDHSLHLCQQYCSSMYSIDVKDHFTVRWCSNTFENLRTWNNTQDIPIDWEH